MLAGRHWIKRSAFAPGSLGGGAAVHASLSGPLVVPMSRLHDALFLRTSRALLLFGMRPCLLRCASAHLASTRSLHFFFAPRMPFYVLRFARHQIIKQQPKQSTLLCCVVSCCNEFEHPINNPAPAGCHASMVSRQGLLPKCWPGRGAQAPPACAGKLSQMARAMQVMQIHAQVRSFEAMHERELGQSQNIRVKRQLVRAQAGMGTRCSAAQLELMSDRGDL